METENNLRKLIEMLYETEALAEMAIRRGEQPSSQTIVRLVKEKCRSLADFTDSWELPKTDENTTGTAEKENLYVASLSDPDREDDVALAQSEMEEIVAMASADPENAVYNDAPMSPQNLELMVPELDPEMEETPTDVRFNPPKQYVEEMKEVEEEKQVPSVPHEVEFVEEEEPAAQEISGQQESATVESSAQRAPLVSLFTINDRFRFRRSLFANDNGKFLSALSIIEGLDTLDEAEDYMSDDLGWNLNDPEVKLFEKIVTKYFDSNNTLTY